ncbi:hypothetical protein GT755_37560 [Herbidospora sp. NEAU-GS84]|uniref:Uncharacterized protein n=1 Tax=Herbidospora solisilvae TaxID=2696284 RepID=A0A7C9JH98_9ACTN|nr:hypothetical protein [Herbidospora solisilvae]NAS27364.1 hypothetical protein [Herbidospora solisilvae]
MSSENGAIAPLVRIFCVALLIAAAVVAIPIRPPAAHAVAPLGDICQLDFSVTTGEDGIGDSSDISIMFGGQRVIFREGGDRVHRGGTGDRPHTTFRWETRLDPCVGSEALLDGFTIEHSSSGDDWDLARLVVTDPTREEPGVQLPVPQPNSPFQYLFMSGTPLHRFETLDIQGVQRWTGHQDRDLDTDGDGLTDLDELRGFTTGSPPLSGFDSWLRQNDADPCRLTIAVEVDWLVDDTTGASDEPTDKTLLKARRMFERAPLPMRPIRCPYYRENRPGVQLLTHKSNAVRTDREQALGAKWSDNRTWFDYYRDGILPGSGNFTPGRQGRFFYSLWGHSWMNDMDGVGGFCCGDPNDNSFVITMGSWTGATEHMAAAAFVHELGHALDLQHNGDSGPNYKPNYLSVMNYRYSGFGLPRYQDWAEALTHMPLGTDLNPSGSDMRKALEDSSDLDYSRERLPLLVRDATTGTWHLNEATGIGTSTGAAVFWYGPDGTLLAGDSRQGLDWDGDGQANPQSTDVHTNVFGGREVCVTDGGDGGLSWETKVSMADQLIGTTVVAGKDGRCDTGPIHPSDNGLVPDSWDALANPIPSRGVDYPARFGYTTGVTGFDDWQAVRFRIGVNPAAGRPLRSADGTGISESEYHRNVTEVIRAFVSSRFPQGLPAEGTVIDATALSAPRFNVSGVSGALDTRLRQALRLSPGRHTLWHVGSAPLTFTVDTAGVVDYAPDVPGVSGRGTHTLTVTGLPVGLDATALAYPYLGLSGLGWWSTSQHQALNLLPGTYSLVVGGVGGWPVKVTAAGRFEYGPQYATMLSGQGTTALTVRGHPITVDATAVSYPHFGLAGHGWWSTRQRQALNLLPGTHTYLGGAFSQPFQVTPEGLVNHEDPPDGRLSGRGTTTLVAE